MFSKAIRAIALHAMGIPVVAGSSKAADSGRESLPGLANESDISE